MVTTLALRLPQGKKFAACFTYDIDALSWPLYVDRATPSLLSQTEFAAVGTERILDLLDKYSVKGSFYIPGHTMETFPELVKEIHRKGHEIGHHGYLHEPPERLSLDEERKILLRGNAIIEEMTGAKPLGYRAPAWNLSNNSVDLLLRENFLYDSSMMAHDYLPYLLRTGDVASKDSAFKFGPDTKLIELPVSWSLDDSPHFDFDQNAPGMGLKAGSGVFENWVDDFDYMRDPTDERPLQHLFPSGDERKGPQDAGHGEVARTRGSAGRFWITRMVDVARACEPGARRA